MDNQQQPPHVTWTLMSLMQNDTFYTANYWNQRFHRAPLSGRFCLCPQDINNPQLAVDIILNDPIKPGIVSINTAYYSHPQNVVWNNWDFTQKLYPIDACGRYHTPGQFVRAITVTRIDGSTIIFDLMMLQEIPLALQYLLTSTTSVKRIGFDYLNHSIAIENTNRTVTSSVHADVHAIWQTLGRPNIQHFLNNTNIIVDPQRPPLNFATITPSQQKIIETMFSLSVPKATALGLDWLHPNIAQINWLKIAYQGIGIIDMYLYLDQYHNWLTRANFELYCVRRIAKLPILTFPIMANQPSSQIQVDSEFIRVSQETTRERLNIIASEFSPISESPSVIDSPDEDTKHTVFNTPSINLFSSMVRPNAYLK